MQGKDTGEKSKSHMAKCFVCQLQEFKLHPKKLQEGKAKPWEVCKSGREVFSHMF